MRSINLKSFYEAHQTMNQEQFNSYMEFFGAQVKEHEKSDIANFIENLIEVRTKFLSGFFIGYKIPQISMEFDLLRIGSNYNLNIEIKNQSDHQKICNQLIKHRYYLGPLDKITHLYSFVSSSGEFYKLEGENIKLTTIDEIVQSIKDQEVIEDPDLNTLFSPGQYLVSPLNSTEKFMENGYFLNNKQQEIKRDIYAWLETAGPSTVSIKGRPGTGKTLLAYDIVKECLSRNKKVLVVHSGMLCQGHHTLNEKYNWEIKPIKHLWDALNSESTYDLILIDEAQRMHEDQLKLVYQYISNKSSKIIFAYDPDQILSKSESEVICEKIESSAYNAHPFKLSEKIRTNKEIAAFISNLYNKSSINTSMDYKNVLIQYFSDPDSLRSYLHNLMLEGWEVLNYTGSTYYRLSFESYQIPAKNAHQIIGQEFDNVAVVINEGFYYGPDGRLLATIEHGSPGYRPDKMLYQKLTRTRERLIVIIYRNKELLNACLKILSKKG